MKFPTILAASGLAILPVSASIVIPSIADDSASNAFNGAVNTVNGSGLSGALANGDSLAAAQALTHLFDGNYQQSYVSNASGSDYFAAGTPPVIVYDLGSDLTIGDVVLWQYQNNGGAADAAGNQARTIELRFNTAAEGFASFTGSATTVNLLPVVDGDGDGGNDLGGTNSAQTFGLSATARYVELTFTDNYRDAQGIVFGGDRVGLGEIAFNAVPEPGTTLLGALGFIVLLRRRRQA